MEGRAADKPVPNLDKPLEFRRTTLKRKPRGKKMYCLPHPGFLKVQNQWLSLHINSVPHPSENGLSLRKENLVMVELNVRSSQ